MSHIPTPSCMCKKRVWCYKRHFLSHGRGHSPRSESWEVESNCGMHNFMCLMQTIIVWTEWSCLIARSQYTLWPSVFRSWIAVPFTAWEEGNLVMSWRRKTHSGWCPTTLIVFIYKHPKMTCIDTALGTFQLRVFEQTLPGRALRFFVGHHSLCLCEITVCVRRWPPLSTFAYWNQWRQRRPENKTRL